MKKLLATCLLLAAFSPSTPAEELHCKYGIIWSDSGRYECAPPPSGGGFATLDGDTSAEATSDEATLTIVILDLLRPVLSLL
jgi:hypothetical protein